MLLIVAQSVICVKWASYSVRPPSFPRTTDLLRLPFLLRYTGRVEYVLLAALQDTVTLVNIREFRTGGKSPRILFIRTDPAKFRDRQYSLDGRGQGMRMVRFARGLLPGGFRAVAKETDA